MAKPVAGLSGRNTTAREQSAKVKHTFVLIHDSWHGGWCWKMVKDHLQARGHAVFTPTMTGLGERSHLVSKDVNLETHITDVSNVLTCEELNDVILVGHGYGGSIVSGVCDSLKEHVAHAVYMNAVSPASGENMLFGATLDEIEYRLGPFVDDFLIPPRQPISFEIPENMTDELSWVRRRVTHQPLGSWTQKSAFQNGATNGLPRTFIYCAAKLPYNSQMQSHLGIFRNDPSWGYKELPCGHDAMVILPEETAALMEHIADETPAAR